MIVVFSPTRGFFIGCEPAGFGGIEGWAEFDNDISKALNLELDAEPFERTAAHHLGYIRPEVPDAVALQGESLEELVKLASLHVVVSS